MGAQATLAIFTWSFLLSAAAGQTAPSQASGPAGLPAGSAVRFASMDAPAEPIEAAPLVTPQATPGPAPLLPEFSLAAPERQTPEPVGPAPLSPTSYSPAPATEAPRADPVPPTSAWERLAMESPIAPEQGDAPAPPTTPATPADATSAPPATEKPLPNPRSFPAEAGADHARRLLRSKTPPEQADAANAPVIGLESLNLPPGALATTGAALAIVVGVLLLSMWCLRRAAPRSARPLPGDVVMVLGQVRLAGKQTAQLMKIGSKLVLVNVTPEGAKPITEITDPDEVARMLGICEQANPNGATAAFQEIFEQLTREPAHGGLTGDEPSLLDRRRLADAYANTPGGRAYG
ncbi:Flagellar biosynthesis protein, FliO [Pirellulimonas nuda]|uniref:Flagellar biosynthesis protein, FliO n=1 Tax=Pirellulimonas nuda TaxID=2528009 RepID=A0A518D9R3_9BACT|nr:flagellar biosynthetic protein FliO [Pirellulimonas nuda]QDU88221.1 Flagellar biosynthesis protein, FliO [Pirellulimonas nuda]